VKFAVTDKTADERVRTVVLSPERVVLRRAVRGIKMAVNLPVTAYLGVAIRLEPPTDDCAGSVSLVLEHRDPALSLPLYRADNADDIIAEWRTWGRVLGLPLLVVEPDGRLREPFQRIGAVQVAAPIRRRRRHTIIRTRRPTQPLRRRPGRTISEPVVHHEREIIARH
jgi:hypothetical protein